MAALIGRLSRLLGRGPWEEAVFWFRGRFHKPTVRREQKEERELAFPEILPTQVSYLSGLRARLPSVFKDSCLPECLNLTCFTPCTLVSAL